MITNVGDLTVATWMPVSLDAQKIWTSKGSSSQDVYFVMNLKIRKEITYLVIQNHLVMKKITAIFKSFHWGNKSSGLPWKRRESPKRIQPWRWRTRLPNCIWSGRSTSVTSAVIMNSVISDNGHKKNINNSKLLCRVVSPSPACRDVPRRNTRPRRCVGLLWQTPFLLKMQLPRLEN